MKIVIASILDFATGFFGVKFESEEIYKWLNAHGYKCRIASRDKLPLLQRVIIELKRLYSKYIIHSFYGFDVYIGKKIAESVLKNKPDVIYCRDVFCAYTVLNKGTSTIMDVVSKISYNLAETGKIKREELKKVLAIEKSVYLDADYIIAKDRRLKEYVEKFGRRKKIAVLYPTIPNYFKRMEASKACLSKLNLQKKSKIILYNPTRLTKAKGVGIVKKLIKLFPQYIFLITGRNNSIGEENVRKLGIVKREELPLFYSIADLVIVPSIPTGEHEEGVTQVVPEAMLCRTPVIASNIGGLKEHKGLIKLVEPNVKAFTKAISDFFERKKYGFDINEAYAYASKFLAKNYMREYVKIIEKAKSKSS